MCASRGLEMCGGKEEKANFFLFLTEATASSEGSCKPVQVAVASCLVVWETPAGRAPGSPRRVTSKVPTVAAEAAAPPSRNSASNGLHQPPALGGNSFRILGQQPCLPWAPPALLFSLQLVFFTQPPAASIQVGPDFLNGCWHTIKPIQLKNIVSSYDYWH